MLFCHGVTSLKFVTGTHKLVSNLKQVSNHINSMARRPHTGVAQHDYTDVMRGLLCSTGQQSLSGCWQVGWNCQMQQDNAISHHKHGHRLYRVDFTTWTSMDFTTWCTANAPGNNFLAWPPIGNSPDLSLIENLWGWMNSKLHKFHKCKNIEELQRSL